MVAVRPTPAGPQGARWVSHAILAHWGYRTQKAWKTESLFVFNKWRANSHGIKTSPEQRRGDLELLFISLSANLLTFCCRHNALVRGCFPRTCQDVIGFTYRVTFLKAGTPWLRNPVWPEGLQTGDYGSQLSCVMLSVWKWGRPLTTLAVSSVEMWAAWNLLSASSRPEVAIRMEPPTRRRVFDERLEWF